MSIRVDVILKNIFDIGYHVGHDDGCSWAGMAFHETRAVSGRCHFDEWIWTSIEKNILKSGIIDQHHIRSLDGRVV